MFLGAAKRCGMTAVVSRSTILQCPTCQKRYCVEDTRLKDWAYRVRCYSCRKIFDARRVRINPRLHSPKSDVSSEGAGSTHALPLFGLSPTANLCEMKLDDYTKIERVTSLDDSSCFIALGTQLSIQGGFPDEALSSFDVNDLSEAERVVRDSILENQKKGGHFPEVRALPVRDASSSFSLPGTRLGLTFSEAVSQKKRRMSFGRYTLMLFCFVFLFGVGIFLQRNDFVGFFPSSYKAMKTFSHFWGKDTAWPKRTHSIHLQAVEIRSDSQEESQLLLTGLLSNKGSQNLAFPSLEVLFLDSEGSLLKKEVFSPEQYLSRDILEKGFLPQSEKNFKLLIPRGSLTKLDSFQVVLR